MFYWTYKYPIHFLDTLYYVKLFFSFSWSVLSYLLAMIWRIKRIIIIITSFERSWSFFTTQFWWTVFRKNKITWETIVIEFISSFWKGRIVKIPIKFKVVEVVEVKYRFLANMVFYSFLYRGFQELTNEVSHKPSFLFSFAWLKIKFRIDFVSTYITWIFILYAIWLYLRYKLLRFFTMLILHWKSEISN